MKDETLCPVATTLSLIGGKYKGILMDAPHNRKFNEREHGIIRVKTWCEIYALIKNMTE